MKPEHFEEKEGMKKTTLILAGAVAGAFVAGPAWATMEMQKAAKAAGIEVTDGCMYCHGEKMPKKDASTYNERGKWLQEQKKAKAAKDIDVTWLKEYKPAAKK
jgi:hypothetical protein